MLTDEMIAYCLANGCLPPDFISESVALYAVLSVQRYITADLNIP